MSPEEARLLILAASDGEEASRAQLVEAGVLRVGAGDPCGDFGEWLVERHLDGIREPIDNPGLDLKAEGERIEVCSRHRKGRRGTRGASSPGALQPSHPT